MGEGHVRGTRLRNRCTSSVQTLNNRLSSVYARIERPLSGKGDKRTMRLGIPHFNLQKTLGNTIHLLDLDSGVTMSSEPSSESGDGK